ncbi:uncharacterized protein LOC110988980 [Acanthaster planci]|uniref:Uncharacterized protein LOC110988980 n=1 Tax=Acanthaster planci TaxID=133434 RepID=A0A8B7ZYQ4_ACAPL|nr:uncharacterized protein LOC110988980 [Acanthaster planci]
MKRKLASLLVVLTMMILSTGITANNQQLDMEVLHQQARPHHHHHHYYSHKRHRHKSDIADDEGEDLTSREDGDAASQMRDDKYEEEEVFYDDFSSRKQLFQLTDKDGDGFVTREEYVNQNGNHSVVVDQVFKAYDRDGDGQFSEEEFLQQSSPLAVQDECEEEIIQTCDKLYLEFMTTELKSSKVDEKTCKAIQYLVDCVVGYDTGCNIQSYARMVATRAQAYLDSQHCPLLDLRLLLKLTGQGALGDEKKTRFARSVDDVEFTTLADLQLYTKQCPNSFIKRCSKKFRRSLARDKAEKRYCPLLASFGHCLKKRAEQCLGHVDETHLRQNIASLKRLQRAAKTCHKIYPTWASQ